MELRTKAITLCLWNANGRLSSAMILTDTNNRKSSECINFTSGQTLSLCGDIN